MSESKYWFLISMIQLVGGASANDEWTRWLLGIGGLFYSVASLYYLFEEAKEAKEEDL